MNVAARSITALLLVTGMFISTYIPKTASQEFAMNTASASRQSSMARK
jgi:hypothetical protein